MEAKDLRVGDIFVLIGERWSPSWQNIRHIVINNQAPYITADTIDVIPGYGGIFRDQMYHYSRMLSSEFKLISSVKRKSPLPKWW